MKYCAANLTKFLPCNFTDLYFPGNNQEHTSESELARRKLHRRFPDNENKN